MTDVRMNEDQMDAEKKTIVSHEHEDDGLVIEKK